MEDGAGRQIEATDTASGANPARAPKKRLPADAWVTARLRWETDSTQTHTSIAEALGVSRPAVTKRATIEGWERAQSLRQIAEQAQLQADKVAVEVTNAALKVAGETSKALVQGAIDLRAGIIETHRADWEEHRELFPVSLIAKDFDLGKRAKITSEMVSIRQKGERAAYGLDATELPPPQSGMADTLTMARGLPRPDRDSLIAHLAKIGISVESR